jgi:2-keto-4-pentenoate hydratase/2-oxohepta-3-ene-1,7-dioic acid hydratase in catechol pathway
MTVNPWRFLNYELDGTIRSGIQVGGTVFDVAAGLNRPEFVSSETIFLRWNDTRRLLADLAASSPEAAIVRHDAKILAPVLKPGAIYCAGANYRDHVEEMAKRSGTKPLDPRAANVETWFFLKTPACIAGPDTSIELPSYSNAIDWEAELAAIIGITARDVPPEDALDHVAGYTVANDLSARDHSKRDGVADLSPFKWDWLSHKVFDGSCPLGPWMVPAWDIPDPQALRISLSVNGVVKQDSNTSQMIYSVAEQISQLSRKRTLLPGDLVLTGTPAGVGAPRGEFLREKDVVEVEIEKIGRLRNTISGRPGAG